MRVDVLTLFPGIFQGYLEESLVRKARDKGILDIRLWNWRDWTEGPHKTVDDRPFGGGPGMVLMCEPLYKAVEAVQSEPELPVGRLVMLTPAGERLTQSRVADLSHEERLVLLCGRYEGFDCRVFWVIRKARKKNPTVFRACLNIRITPGPGCFAVWKPRKCCWMVTMRRSGGGGSRWLWREATQAP